MAVDIDGHYNEPRPRHELEIDAEPEEIHRHHRGDDDAEAGREPLEDVVRVLDDDSDQETPEGLHGDHEPHVVGVAEEEPLLDDSVSVLGPDAEDTGEHPEESQLDVAQPDGALGALEDLLKVDAGES